MNLPGTSEGNWSWQLRPGQLTKRHAARLREATAAAGRSPDASAPFTGPTPDAHRTVCEDRLYPGRRDER